MPLIRRACPSLSRQQWTGHIWETLGIFHDFSCWLAIDGDSWDLYDLFFVYSCLILEKNKEFNRTKPTKFVILPCSGMACWDDDRWVFRVQQLGIVTTTGIVGDWLTCSDFEEIWGWMDTMRSWSVYDMCLFQSMGVEQDEDEDRIRMKVEMRTRIRMMMMMTMVENASTLSFFF